MRFIKTYFNQFFREFGVAQVDAIERLESVVLKRGGRMMTLLPRGYGKALSLDTKIPTPDGMKTMGTILPGDVVFDEKGERCNVTAVTETFDPEKCYFVKFDDGEVIHACSEHQWQVNDRGSVIVTTTQGLVDNFFSDRFSIEGSYSDELRSLFPDVPESGNKRIIAIEPAPVVPMRCIMVDSPNHLYLCGERYTVTHNSSLSEVACIWAALYGHCRFILCLAGNTKLAKTFIESIKIELESNELLYEDFPEVCIPVENIEQSSARANKQLQGNEPTRFTWAKKEITFPAVKDHTGQFSAASGVVVVCDGIDAASRGSRKKDHLGNQQRPDLVICDDPQTDRSARSVTMTRARLDLINNTLLRLGKHGSPTSININATMICQGDLVDTLCDRRKYPSWLVVRHPMVIAMPTALETHWLGEYARIRNTYDSDDLDDQWRARGEATAYYLDHREEMDHGSICSWDDIPLDEHEVSSIQHAMNILIDEGPVTFAAECQNQPMDAGDASPIKITRSVITRFSQLPRTNVHEIDSHIVASIDVQETLLYYSILSVQNDFTGSIIDYGTWPEQPAGRYYTLKSAPVNFVNYYGLSVEANIVQGLTDLCKILLERKFDVIPSIDGNDSEPRGITCISIDTAYRSDLTKAVCTELADPKIMLYRGFSRGLQSKQMSEYDMSPKKVIKFGPSAASPSWYLPRDQYDPVSKTYTMHADVNVWKSFVASRLTQIPDKGMWRLYGKLSDRKIDHTILFDHLTAELPKQFLSMGKQLTVWSHLPGRDNHFLDTLTANAAVASLCGAQLFEGTQAQQIARIARANQQQAFDAAYNQRRRDGNERGGNFFVTSRRPR